MIGIWYFFILEMLIFYFLNITITNTNNLAIIFMIINILVTSTIILSSKNKYKKIIILAYFSRIIIMLWDLFGRNIFVIPNSGADSYHMHIGAVQIANNFTLSNLVNSSLDIYSKFLSIFYHTIGPSMGLGLYINVLFGTSVIIVISKIINYLNFRERNSKNIILLSSFFPNSLIMSGILLREIIPTFFVTVSLFYFVKYQSKNRIQNLYLSLIAVFISAMFHTGVIGILIGYLITHIFYDKKKSRFHFNFNKIISLSINIFILLVFMKIFGALSFNKFSNLKNMNDLYNTANARHGGSVYLKGIEINNIMTFFIFAPVKTLYFYTSPLPWNWRNIMDIVSFSTDSILYINTIYLVFKHKKMYFDSDKKEIIITIILSILFSGIIYGIGVSNAGTAIRHRQKLVSLFIILNFSIRDTLNRKKVI